MKGMAGMHLFEIGYVGLPLNEAAYTLTLRENVDIFGGFNN